MTIRRKLAAFALVLAAVFGAGFGIGTTVGDGGPDERAPAGEEHTP